MSTILVPKPYSWWANKTQPDAPLVEVTGIAASQHDVFIVIYKYGPRNHDVSAITLTRFFETFTERDT